MRNHTDWRPRPAIEEIEGFETWTHTAPHEINEGDVEGDLDLSDLIDDDADDE
ncbi:hypothetical protein GCM10027435_05540 [Haloparvum alkalitolerans]|uniref:hypothetical protein n=1 Tax=Haloparvum TaxID=1820337 RepID=UPI00159ED444|nr:hypothetical protein [Haloparvum sedimenti]